MSKRFKGSQLKTNKTIMEEIKIPEDEIKEPELEKGTDEENEETPKEVSSDDIV